MADEQRIAVLERHVRAIYEQLDALREELRARGLSTSAPPRAEPAEAASPLVDRAPIADARDSRVPPAPPRPAGPAAPDLDLEKLVGRYGTIAVASLAILMGVGTFLSWAIEHGHLGPTIRVVLGFVGAAVVAGVGNWVREKRDVRFGNVLLALSLAIVHVDAWAAGPYLQVISTTTALTIAALASAALAVLALTSDERTLFAIGFAGAMAAPFVTAREPGSVVMLLTYGWVVIALSLFAIRERGWEPVRWFTVVAAALYVLAAAEGPTAADHSWLAMHAPVAFSFACVVAALLFARNALRSRLALSFLALACLATLGYAIHVRTLEVGMSVVGIAASYLIARELETDESWLVIGNIIIPLGFTFATMFAAADQQMQALIAASLTVVSGTLAWEDEDERAHHLFVAAIASGTAIIAYLVDSDTRCIGALALHAAVFAMLIRSTRSRALVPPVVLGLCIATAWTLYLLTERSSYTYMPFLTIPSLCAAGVTGAWALLAYAVQPTDEETGPERAKVAILMTSLAMIVGFGWVRQELVESWSPDTASFALIVYYAVVGLALISTGRWRRIGELRAVGLAFAFYAGYKALVETFTIDAIGLRVGARILVGVFLAAVAYWYRVPVEPGAKGGEAPQSDEKFAAPPTGAEATSSAL